MNMDRLLASVKKHEGYRNKVYLDTLGKRTVGVGHLCVEEFWEDDKEYEEKFLMTILEHDLQTAIKGAKDLMSEHGCMDMDEVAEEIIIEMIFQLGKTGVSKFKNMWKALSGLEYSVAASENVRLTLGKTNSKQSTSNECGDGVSWLGTSGSGFGTTITLVTSTEAIYFGPRLDWMKLFKKEKRKRNENSHTYRTSCYNYYIVIHRGDGLCNW
jgi:GH24 family phage-related lysozyme (muramidase)